LKEQQDQSGGFATLIIGFAVLKALRGLGIEPLRNPCGYLDVQGRNLWSPDRAGRNLVGWLASASRCIALWHDHAMSLTARMRARIAAILRNLSNDDGGYGTPGSSLPETGAALAISRQARIGPGRCRSCLCPVMRGYALRLQYRAIGSGQQSRSPIGRDDGSPPAWRQASMSGSDPELCCRVSDFRRRFRTSAERDCSA